MYVNEWKAAKARTEKYPETKKTSEGIWKHSQLGRGHLQLVVVGVQGRNIRLEALSGPDAPHQLLEFASLVERRPVHYVPVIKHILWEGLTGSS